MRRLLIAFLAVLIVAVGAHAGTLDPGRIAAIDAAAKDFLARAAEAKKTGTVPRQSEPAVGPLLDTVFDTRELSHGPVPYADLPKLDDWQTQIARVGQVYVLAGRPLHDLGVFGPEIGRYFDSLVTLLRAMADALATEADGGAGDKPTAAELHTISGMHGVISRNLDEVIGQGLSAPGLTAGWVDERLAVLTAAGPSFARFLKPDELARLRQTTIALARRLRGKTVRTALAGFAVALSEPRAPIATPKEPASTEIALRPEGGEYSVSGRVNGAATVTFYVDSGASVVVLPKNLVDDMIKSGTIATGDLRGRNTYISADGKRHHGTWLVLRQLEVGGHVVTDVLASVAPEHAHALLGQSFLAKFKSWTLDNKRHVLALVE